MRKRVSSLSSSVPESMKHAVLSCAEETLDRRRGNTDTGRGEEGATTDQGRAFRRGIHQFAKNIFIFVFFRVANASRASMKRNRITSKEIRIQTQDFADQHTLAPSFCNGAPNRMRAFTTACAPLGRSIYTFRGGILPRVQWVSTPQQVGFSHDLSEGTRWQEFHPCASLPDTRITAARRFGISFFRSSASSVPMALATAEKACDSSLNSRKARSQCCDQSSADVSRLDSIPVHKKKAHCKGCVRFVF